MAGRPTKQQAQGKVELGYPLDWNYQLQRTSLTPEVSGRQLLAELQLMADTDETVGSMMWCICSTLQQVDWKHVPQIDGKDDETDPQAMAAAQFADTLLLDMRRSFRDHVDDAMAMIWAGFAPCEIVLKQRLGGDTSRYSDAFWGIDDIPLRDPLSVNWWIYDEERRHVIALRQMAVQGGATIPMWKVCNYRTTSAADMPQGRPLLKNAWRAWRLKNRIQDSEAIGIERELVGLPIFRVPEADITAAAETENDGTTPTASAKAAQKRLSNAITTVQSIRMNKTGGLVLPSDTYASDDPQPGASPARKYDFETLTSSGQRSIDARTAARDYDRAIARTVMMQFLHLGDRSTGSYGLSDDQSSMAIRALMSLAFKVGDEFSRQALGLVWTANAMDPRYRPTLRPSAINKEGLQQLGAFLNGLAKNEWLVGADPKARTSVLRAAGIDYDRDAQEEGATRSAEAADAAAMAPPPAGGPPQGDPEA